MECWYLWCCVHYRCLLLQVIYGKVAVRCAALRICYPCRRRYGRHDPYRRVCGVSLFPPMEFGNGNLTCTFSPDVVGLDGYSTIPDRSRGTRVGYVSLSLLCYKPMLTRPQVSTRRRTGRVRLHLHHDDADPLRPQSRPIFASGQMERRVQEAVEGGQDEA